nr:hypothetical protein [Tanacetum cinerariifolium]
MPKNPYEGIPNGDLEEDPEEEPDEESAEASEGGSNPQPPDYTTPDEETVLDLISTARGGPKFEEMEDTCESSVRPELGSG